MELNIQNYEQASVSFHVLCVSTLLSILTLVFIALLPYSYLLIMTQVESKRLDIVSYGIVFRNNLMELSSESYGIVLEPGYVE